MIPPPTPDDLARDANEDYDYCKGGINLQRVYSSCPAAWIRRAVAAERLIVDAIRFLSSDPMENGLPVQKHDEYLRAWVKTTLDRADDAIEALHAAEHERDELRTEVERLRAEFDDYKRQHHPTEEIS